MSSESKKLPISLYEVGARSYEYTGRSNAAWVRVKKQFPGLWPAVKEHEFHHSPG